MYIIRNTRNGFFYFGYGEDWEPIFEPSKARFYSEFMDALDAINEIQIGEYYDCGNLVVIDLSDKVPNYED